MFTVLIAEKKHIDAIQQENRLFFEPFLETRKLAFCQWNPEGQSLLDSVPGLLDAVGRQKSWRAVIINPCEGEQLKARNPFDIVNDNVISDLSTPELQPHAEEQWDEWETAWKTYFDELTCKKEAIYRSALRHPLQKLTTWLCYKPEGYILHDVAERQDIHDWAMEKIGRDAVKASAKLSLMEREQSKRELRLKELLRKEFVASHYLNIAYPHEVHCISLRTADNSFFDPDTYWNIRTDHEYSKFADRNMYFDKMRFMVFDLLPSTHRAFRTDYIRFLATVLIIASNPVPGSAMQTRHLYALDVESDETPLCTLVTSYDRKLASTSQVIDNEMDKIRNEIPSNLSDKDVESLLSTTKEVAVKFDDIQDEQRVYIDNDFGLFFDYPENEFVKWNESYGNSREELAYVIKQYSRSIRKSVGQAKLSSKILDLDAGRITPRLTAYQIEDIKEYTNHIENEMIAAIPPDLTDISQYLERLEKDSQNVQKVIKQRMTKNTAMALSVCFLSLFAFCFLPFVFTNMNRMKTILSAAVFAGVLLALQVVIIFLILLYLRRKLKKAVNAYNDTVKSIMEEMNASMDDFSKYISASCNVRRGHAVQNYSNKNTDAYTKRLRIRIKHQQDIQRKRALLAEVYRDYFGDSTYCDKIMATPYDYDFDQQTEYTYPAPFLAGDSRQIELFGSGNYVTVPSSYIKSILVRMEGIYEK